MLEPLKHFLNSQKIILASGSSWRKTILEKNLVNYFLFDITFIKIIIQHIFKGVKYNSFSFEFSRKFRKIEI